MSLFIPQYMVHYLISRKVSHWSPPPALCSFGTARPSGMQWIAKMKQPHYPKIVLWWGTLPNGNIHLAHRGPFGPFLCEAQDEERVVTIQKHWSVWVLEQWVLPPLSILGGPQCNSSMCRWKQGKVFAKLCCINSQMGLMLSYPKCLYCIIWGRQAMVFLFYQVTLQLDILSTRGKNTQEPLSCNGNKDSRSSSRWLTPLAKFEVLVCY